MSNSKPTFVLVPGAWHPASCYDALLHALSSRGYETVSEDNASLDAADPAQATCSKDTAAIRHILERLCDAGKSVILIAHSYGGIPAAAAAHQLGTTARKQAGKPGGVIGLAWIAAFLIAEGDTLLDRIGGKFAPFCIMDTPREDCSIVDNPKAVFYACASDAVGDQLAAKIRPQAMLPKKTPVGPPAWAEPEFDGRLAYLRCAQDQAIPAVFQDMMIEATNVKWDVKHVDADHSPFASQTEPTADWLVDLAHKFSAKVA